MLQHLFIKDLAIVAHVDINFSEGITVITGETGAGKSILLDALHLALGERADSHWIRPGAEKAEIAVTFDISELPGAILWLAELELTADHQQCMIRRILYANGRSKAYINGRPATSQQLRVLGEHLIQIHGQHQHQLLLKTAEQLRLLDAFGQHDAQVSQVKTIYKEWEKLQQQLELARNNTLEQARTELLQYQIAEIEALQLQDNELEQLHQEQEQLAHAHTFRLACENALSLLAEQDANAIQSIYQAQQALRNLSKYKAITNAQECLQSALIQLQEATTEINHFVQELEIDPQRLQEVEQRLEKIHDMARKHKVDPVALLAHYQHLTQQMEQYTQAAENIAQLTEKIRLAEQRYQQCARQLTAARQQTALKLAQMVTQTIQQLGMPGALFAIDLVPHSDVQLHAHGNETCLFAISANPGHAPQPLHKVASGGELSRVSLALELITAQFLATPCLIFDEVDVGISGKIGAIVGKALYDLSKKAQVLCITHLPQVAAFGDQHLHVVKTRSGESTVSELQVLSEAQRIEEIARMLGGLDVSTQARANAKQLLKHKKTLASA